MSMTVKSYEQILNDMKSRNVSGLDTSEGSFVDAVLRPVAFVLAAWNFDLAALAAQVSPDTAVGAYLENQAKDYGIVRKPGSKATAQVTFAGTDGIEIPAGTAVQTATGLVFLTDEAVVIADGTATVDVTSEYVGSVCNVEENAICSMQSLTKVSVSASTQATGGSDAEIDDELRSRLLAVRRRTPASCNEAQYELWAREVPGVGKVYVWGRWNGPGTVKLVLADDDGIPLAEDRVEAVRQHIEPKREVCTEVTCVPADLLEISVSAQVEIQAGASLTEIQEEFTALLKKYLSNIALTGNPIVFNRVAHKLLSIEGVTDFTALTINGQEENIETTKTTSPAVKEVSIT